MLKRFSITLIIISTLVYGSMFIMAKYYGTGFFDEMLMQMNRLAAVFVNKKEIKQSKRILFDIIENEHPTGNFQQWVMLGKKSSHEELFYHYKVWIVKSGLSREDVEKSYPIFKALQDNTLIINMRYGPGKPVVQFPFVINTAGQIITGLFYPVNELPLAADLNKDNTIDHRDVILARKLFKGN